MTRRTEFSAAHRYLRPEWDEARNLAAFGDCTRPHGHSYVLEVSVSGPVDPRTGMLFSMAELKRILDEEVLARFDHRQLEADVPELRGRIPTSENIAQVLWDRLSARVESAAGKSHRLSRLRLFETGKLFAEIGEERKPDAF
jgi:6-pyruvoyltetrahydropterin/6-carboxytetrahydropterin synthase